MKTTTEIGNIAESRARKYLEKNGLKHIDSNFKFHDVGEVDLIMRDGDYLVFTEVRMRRSRKYGTSIESISRTKQRRIIRAALAYLQREKSLNKEKCRFDAVGVDAEDKIIWIKNAFEVQ